MAVLSWALRIAVNVIVVVVVVVVEGKIDARPGDRGRRRGHSSTSERVFRYLQY
jgi:hypothetical protein